MGKSHANGFLDLVNDAKTRVRECTTVDVKEWQDAERSFFLVDVREDTEWAMAHLPGAVHLGKGVIERDIEKVIPDHEAEIVLYCGGGYRSARFHGRTLPFMITPVTWQTGSETGLSRSLVRC